MSKWILSFVMAAAVGLLWMLLFLRGDRVVVLHTPDHAELQLHYEYRPNWLTLGPSRSHVTASARNWRLKSIEIRHEGRHAFAYPTDPALFSKARPVLISTPSGWGISEPGDCEAYTIGIEPVRDSYRIVVSDVSYPNGALPMNVRNAPW